MALAGSGVRSVTVVTVQLEVALAAPLRGCQAGPGPRPRPGPAAVTVTVAGRDPPVMPVSSGHAAPSPSGFKFAGLGRPHTFS